MFGNMFSKLSRYGLVSVFLKRSRVSIFTRNICNHYIETFKILFDASSSQTWSAMATTIWRPGSNERNRLSTYIECYASLTLFILQSVIVAIYENQA